MSRRPSRRPALRRVDGILLLDKPSGLSSNEALQKVRLLYGAEKGGHTGSLDPLATGLLPICLGEATKLCGVLLDGDKHYRAQVMLGIATSTGDAEGEAVAWSDPALIDSRAILDVLPGFIGEIDQIPPMYSAIKHQGQPLYSLARAGVEVDRSSRHVTVHRLELLAYADGVLELEVRCSKGTYIRTLAEDIAAALGQRAHLTKLRRIGAEPFCHPVSMFSLDQLELSSSRSKARLNGLLQPPAAGLTHWPHWRAPEAALARLTSGGKLFQPGLSTGRLAVLDAAQGLRVLAEVDEQGWIHPRRCLLTPLNRPGIRGGCLV